MCKHVCSKGNLPDQKQECSAAFALLDTLTKSGRFPLEHACLHILTTAATHQFDESVTETFVQDNVNPIDNVERSMLIMASMVHQAQTTAMLADGQQSRVATTSPQLYLEDAPEGGEA